MENNIFYYIKNQVDIVEVISCYVNLVSMGYYYKGFSPFKTEKTPSFTVTPDKKIFYCFSTNQGGDVIDFVSRVENCSQYEAALFLIEKYQIPTKNIGFFDGKKEKKSESNEKYFKIYKKFVFWAEQELIKNDEAKSFLKKRKISFESVKKFTLGFCPQGKDFKNFIQELKKEGILYQEVIDIGLAQKNYSSLFSDRIVFPIQNSMGLFCGCGGRILTQNISVVKYLNSQQSHEFSKKKLLYGFHQAKESIKLKKEAFIVEGYLDVIMMSQCGFENVVGSMGTALTKEHIDFLKRFVNKIIFVYDGDSAGQNAIQRAIHLLWSELLDVDVVILPPGKDPCSLGEENILSEALLKRISGIDFFIQNKKSLLKENTSLKNSYELVSEIVNNIALIQDPAKKKALIFKSCQELNIPVEFLAEKDGSKENLSKSRQLIEAKPVRNKDDYEKKNFLLLFYFSILCFGEEYCNIDELINIFNLNNYQYCSQIIIEYNFICIKYSSFLDYIKEKHLKIYEHILKISSKYIFSKKTYTILYKKIIEISWKNYKKNNLEVSISDFLILIKQKI